MNIRKWIKSNHFKTSSAEWSCSIFDHQYHMVEEWLIQFLKMWKENYWLLVEHFGGMICECWTSMTSGCGTRKALFESASITSPIIHDGHPISPVSSSQKDWADSRGRTINRPPRFWWKTNIIFNRRNNQVYP